MKKAALLCLCLNPSAEGTSRGRVKERAGPLSFFVGLVSYLTTLFLGKLPVIS